MPGSNGSRDYVFVSSGSNIPASDTGIVCAIQYDDSCIVQYALTLSNKFYTRSRMAGTWSSWCELASKSDLDSYPKTLTTNDEGHITHIYWSPTYGIVFNTKDGNTRYIKAEYVTAQ